MIADTGLCLKLVDRTLYVLRRNLAQSMAAIDSRENTIQAIGHLLDSNTVYKHYTSRHEALEVVSVQLQKTLRQTDTMNMNQQPSDQAEEQPPGQIVKIAFLDQVFRSKAILQRHACHKHWISQNHPLQKAQNGKYSCPVGGYFKTSTQKRSIWDRIGNQHSLLAHDLSKVDAVNSIQTYFMSHHQHELPKATISEWADKVCGN